MILYSLREVCELAGVTRRAVQGYEKAGLVEPSGRNKRGYLLYDEKALERIRQIHLFQQFGFKVKEIGLYLDAPGDVLKEVLLEKRKHLQKEVKAKKNLIQRLDEFIHRLV